MTAFIRRSVFRPNRKDRLQAPRRIDTISPFINAGFRQDSDNPHVFYLQSYSYKFQIAPSFRGLKVTSETMIEAQLFAYGTSPDIIADWCIDFAATQHQALAPDWLTEGLPEGGSEVETVPGCYGLGKGVDYA